MNVEIRKPVSANTLPPSMLSIPGLHGRDASRQELKVKGAVICFDRNAIIFDEGDKSRSSYKVMSGAVRLCKYFADGRRQVTAFFLPGDVFGIDHFEDYAFTAEAVTNVSLVRLADKSSLENGWDHMSEIGNILHSRVSLTMAHLLMLGRKNVTERVASFLLQLAKRRKTAIGPGYILDLHMGRQDIADYLGLTIETVCRSLSAMKREGVISIPNTHQIVFCRLQSLHALAGSDE